MDEYKSNIITFFIEKDGEKGRRVSRLSREKKKKVKSVFFFKVCNKKKKTVS